MKRELTITEQNLQSCIAALTVAQNERDAYREEAAEQAAFRREDEAELAQVTEERDRAKARVGQAASIIERWRPVANFGATDYTAEEIAEASASLARESDEWLVAARAFLAGETP